MKLPNAGRAYTAAVLYAFIIGFSFLFVKLALEAASPLDTLAHRFTVSFAGFSVALLIVRRRVQLRAKELVKIGLLSLFYPFLFFTFQTYGLVYTTSSEAGIIHATVPILTMVLASWFLKERSTWLQKLFTLLSVAGVVSIFALKGVQLEAAGTRGIVLLLLSALSSAVYSVGARKLLKQKLHLLDITFVMNLIGFLLFNGMAVVRHASQGTLQHYFDPFAVPAFIGAILYLGILSSTGSLLLSNYALTHMKASNLSVFNNLATLITLLGGVAILHEQLANYHLLGAAMVLAGVIGVSFSGRRKMPESSRREQEDASMYGQRAGNSRFK